MRRLAASVLVLALLALALWRCTVQVDVPQPEIRIECVEVVLGQQTTRYCDAGD